LADGTTRARVGRQDYRLGSRARSSTYPEAPSQPDEKRGGARKALMYAFTSPPSSPWCSVAHDLRRTPGARAAAASIGAAGQAESQGGRVSNATSQTVLPIGSRS
jgi:hypothetical protein